MDIETSKAFVKGLKSLDIPAKKGKSIVGVQPVVMTEPGETEIAVKKARSNETPNTIEIR